MTFRFDTSPISRPRTNQARLRRCPGRYRYVPKIMRDRGGCPTTIYITNPSGVWYLDTRLQRKPIGGTGLGQALEITGVR